MARKRRIFVVTGSPAEYGLLRGVMQRLHADPEFDLRVIVTGMHLSQAHGRTVQSIEADGLPISALIDIDLSDDSGVGIARSISRGVTAFAELFARESPDLVLVLGDRFEILAVAVAALVSCVPLAHIAGGDTTEGAFDEAIRHSITKMAQIHFVTNDLSARRVRQMGEDGAHVFQVGSPGIDEIVELQPLSRETLERDLGCKFRARNLLVTFHPVTLETDSVDQLDALLSALERLGDEVCLFITRPNADPGNRALVVRLESWILGLGNACLFHSLGQRRYLSLMSEVDAVVGNSSSGLYEAPSFGIPTVDIGSRQAGRLAAASVIRCHAQSDAILAAIRAAFVLDCSGVTNPYGDGHSAERIVAKLKSIPDYRVLMKKQFVLREG